MKTIKQLKLSLKDVYFRLKTGQQAGSSDPADELAFYDAVKNFMSPTEYLYAEHIRNALEKTTVNMDVVHKNYLSMVSEHFYDEFLYEEAMLLITQRIAIEISMDYCKQVSFEEFHKLEWKFKMLSYNNNIVLNRCISKIKKNRSILIKGQTYLPIQYIKVFNIVNSAPLVDI